MTTRTIPHHWHQGQAFHTALTSNTSNVTVALLEYCRLKTPAFRSLKATRPTSTTIKPLDKTRHAHSCCYVQYIPRILSSVLSSKIDKSVLWWHSYGFIFTTTSTELCAKSSRLPEDVSNFNLKGGRPPCACKSLPIRQSRSRPTPQTIPHCSPFPSISCPNQSYLICFGHSSP